MLQFYTIALIAVLAAVSPGPDFVVVMKNALCRSRRHALSCTIGVCLGILFHSIYCVLGLGLLISKSVVLFNIIKVIGATYLIYLGVKNLFVKPNSIPITQDNTPKANSVCHAKTPYHAFREGFFANVLNPKCTLFMLSIFTVVIEPSTSQWIKAAYSFEIMLIALIWFCFLSISITLKPVQKKLAQAQTFISRFTGIVLIALGIRVAFEKAHLE